MGDKQIVPPVVDNSFLDILQASDGNSLNRAPEPRNPPCPDPNGSSPIISKDVTLDPCKKTWLRLYLPRESVLAASASPKKLPLIFYYHGGGFVFSSADASLNDIFCCGLVESVGAMVISLDYRLAPEHRLPAAYEDALDGLYWTKNTKDEWVRDYANLEECYLCGTSSGGNLAYNAGLRAVAAAKDLEPLKIKGLVLHHPYFSCTKRTSSEERLANDFMLPRYAIDLMFDLSLPKGVDHDHEFCNPLVNGGSKHIDKMKDLGWRIMVAGCSDDPLVDLGVHCASMLDTKGLRTVRFFREGFHAMELFVPATAGPLYAAIKDFVFEN